MIYKIKKGNHRSGIRFAPRLFEKEINFTFKLDESCWTKPITENDFDINKLYGVSFGLHHKNSIRLGWVPSLYQGQIEIYAYWYNKGKRKFTYMASIDVKTEAVAEINFNTEMSWCGITLKNKSLNCVKYYCFLFDYPKFKHGYYLFPFHGGDNPAKQDMKIEINKL